MTDETDGTESTANEFSLDQFNKALELFSHFSIENATIPYELSDLSDGVALFEVLSEYAPSYFDMCAISCNTKGNWIVKKSNLRMLLSNLDNFFEDFLGRSVDINQSYRLVDEVAQNSSTKGIISILELFTFAVVKTEQKLNADNKMPLDFANKVMSLDEVSQKIWMKLADRGSKRNKEAMNPPQSQTEYPRLDTSIMSPISTYGHGPSFLSPASPGCFSEDNDLDNSSIFLEKYGATHLFEGNSMDIEAIIKERDELRKENEKIKKDNASLQSNLDSAYSEAENDANKFRSLLKDYEKQITGKVEELHSINKELSIMKDKLEKAEHLVDQLEYKNAELADQVDIADATSMQLQKAEMTLKIYKEKLEEAGDLSQSINELENRTEAYMLKTIELENNCKKIPKLEETVKDLKNKLVVAETRNHEQDEMYQEISNENKVLKGKLESAERKASSYKQEAMELREQQRIGTEVENDIHTVSDITLTSAAEYTLSRERIIKLEYENSNLKDQLAQYSSNISYHTDENDDLITLQAKYKSLVQINKKLKKEKDKLEYHTKAQVEKFQHKYLDALHECKMKLTEKQETIHKQDQRMKDERDAHKREEKLLSYAVYEMGSAVIQMQMENKLK